MTVTISGLCRSGTGPSVSFDGHVTPYHPENPLLITGKALAQLATRAFPRFAARAQSARQPKAAATALSTHASLTCQREEF